jgi:periplasmic protein CpxP/Spy
MKRTHTVVAGLVAGIALGVAALAIAQPFGGMGPGFGPGMGMGPGHGPMAGVDPSAMIDSRLSDMKAQLKITTAQEGAWQTFTAAAKQQAAGMQAMRAQMQQDPGTAPGRMAQRSTAMQQRSDAMATMTNAFNALYAVLSPEQKAVADQSFGMMGGRGMRFGPRAG